MQKTKLILVTIVISLSIQTISFATAKPVISRCIVGNNQDSSVAKLDDFAISAAQWFKMKKTITIASLLDEMVDRDRIARYPDPFYYCKQFSSYNRASVTPDDYKGWFADSDGTQCIRTEVNSKGQTEWVLMEHNGPGVVTHLWTPYFYYSLSNHIGPKLRFYIDGSKSPVIEEDFIPFLGGKRFLKPPFATTTVRAVDIYFPITFSKSCKITTNAKNFYYIIDYRAYEPGTIVESFTMDKFKALTNKIREVGKKLQNIKNFKGSNTVSFNDTLAKKTKASVSLPRGPAAIRKIEITVDKFKIPQVLRSAVLVISFDGEETVWVPLADFFSGVKQRAYNGWYRSVEANGKMITRFVMPYRQSGRIKIVNYGKETISVNLTATIGNWSWDNRSMHFHANWRYKYPQTTIPCSDFNFINIKGKGVYVGDMLSVGVPIGGWWGEGDEKIYVDGDTFPTHFGTGTEDYYGYAGGVVPAVTDFFDEPFIGQIRAECFPKGQNVQYRTRVLDAIPFKTSLSMNMEISRALFGAKVDHEISATTFWYALPGATSNRGNSAKDAARAIALLSP